MGAGSPAPLCQQGSRNAAENILQPQCGCPLWGRRRGVICHCRARRARSARTSGRGHHVAGGRGRLPGQPPRFQPPGAPRGPLRRRQRCGRRSGPPQPCRERACPRLAGRRCQHLPAWCPSLLGGRLPRRRVPLVPRAAAPADSPAQLQAAAARGRAMLRAPGPHRPSALALPPRALLFHPGDPRDVLPPRPASVGEQCWPPSRGAGEIGHEEACRPPRPDAGWRAQALQPRVLQMQGQALQLQCHVRPSREERPRPQPRTQAAPERYECPAAVTGSPLQEAPCRHVALQQPRGLPQDLRALAEREADPPQPMVGGRQKGPGPGTSRSPGPALPR